MKDLTPLGTGNSRFMKSGISPNTTYQQLLTMLINGTFPFDFNGINPAGISQMGSAYSVANVLPEDVCTELDIPTTSEPKDAFNRLSPSISIQKYWWRRRTYTPSVVDATISNAYNSYRYFAAIDGASDDSITVKYSTSCDIVEGNKIALSQPVQTVSGSYNSYTNFEVLKGKYCEIYNVDSAYIGIAYVPTNATIGRILDTGFRYYLIGATNDGTTTLTTSNSAIVGKKYGIVYGDWENIWSYEKTTYPFTGVQDGFEYDFIKIPITIAQYMTNIQTLEYTGSNTNSLTLAWEVVPQIIIISRVKPSVSSGTDVFIPIAFLFPRNNFGYCFYDDSTLTRAITVTYDEYNNVTLSSTSYFYIMNTSGYSYVAIGFN